MNIAIKAALISICVILITSFVKNIKSEYSLVAALAGGLSLILILIPNVKEMIEKTREIFSFSYEADGSVRIFIKAVLICQICSLVKSFCRDSSNSFMASCVDITEKTAIFIISMPLIESVIKIILNYIGT